MKTKRLRGSSRQPVEYRLPTMLQEERDINLSVQAARETDRRLKARSRSILTDILNVTYEAIRRRPEVFTGLLLLMLTECGSRPRPHVTWPTEELDYNARWKCEAQDPHNTTKDCTKRAFHFRVKR